MLPRHFLAERAQVVVADLERAALSRDAAHLIGHPQAHYEKALLDLRHTDAGKLFRVDAAAERAQAVLITPGHAPPRCWGHSTEWLLQCQLACGPTRVLARW